MKLLEGKKGLILGAMNKLSLAWSIAEKSHQHGADLCFSFQGPQVEKRITPLAQELGIDFIQHCDVTDSDSISLLFHEIKKRWGSLDFIIHSIAFSDRNELTGRFINTSLDNFTNSLHISCYSLVEIARHAEPLLNKGGSILTMTYYGAEKVIPNYNVMGVAKAALEASVRYLANDMGTNNIRVNAISAGPMKTLAASGISGFSDMMKVHENSSPLRRNTNPQDIAGAGLYLISNLSSGVTGEIHHVDSGYNILGMPEPKLP